ncbi:MAG: amidohydrolase [Gemmatimonadaceae bacterium]|nr:amidohydrolase [Gemmatimonadaceae bacterium]
MPTTPRRPLALLLIAAVAAATPATGAAQGPLPADLSRRIDALEPKIVAWRRDIHQHPELGNRETRTAKIVADHLRALGIATTTNVAHTGVVGILRGGRPGPVILLRADMDALPVTERNDLPFASKVRTTYNGVETGVMHACGHDTHVAIMMGVAEALASMRGDLPGTIKFMFQPAEEGPPQGERGGAELMIEEGVLENPKVDVAFALHINSQLETGHISYSPGGTYASADDFRILVKGTQTHGGYPWDGTDPVVAAAHIITGLQTIVSRNMRLTENPAVVTVGKITGGVRSNIIPEEVELVGTLRALSPDDRAKVHQRVREIATGIGTSMGAKVEVQIPLTTAYPVTYNDPALTARMVPLLASVVGADRVHLVKPVTGAEDFGFVAERVPSFYFRLGGRKASVDPADAAPHHTPGFHVEDTDLEAGVKAFVALVLGYRQ